jgi:hypothetical protein
MSLWKIRPECSHIHFLTKLMRNLNLILTIKNYLKLLKIIWNYWKLFETIENYLKLLKIICLQKLFETVKNYSKLLKIIQNYYKLFKTIKNYSKLLKLFDTILDPRHGIRINYLEVFVAGGLSQSVVVPALVAPVERVKVLLQVPTYPT